MRSIVSGVLVLAAVLVAGNELAGGISAAVLVLAALIVQGVRT